MDKAMIYIRRILVVILSPLFILTITVDAFMFAYYYIATGRNYCIDYQPFGFALFGWLNGGCKQGTFNWKWEDLWTRKK
jgi:hypothetical protein